MIRGKAIHVAHVISDLRPMAGGTSRVVVDVCDALARSGGVEVSLLTQSRPNDSAVEAKCPEVVRLTGFSNSRFRLAAGLPMRSELNRLLRENSPKIIHSHGVWLGVNYWSAAISSAHRIPLIVQPHGMLAPWALEHRAWKKKAALRLFQDAALHGAALMVATSDQEFEDIRGLGYRAPVAVIPNGVDLDSVGRTMSSARRPEGSERVVLFLGRLHPVKGLPNLLRAWSKVRRIGWRLRIAGPDEAGHLSELMELAESLELGASVEFPGAVAEVDKFMLYQGADLFVLPSHTENFGVVVAEALAHQVPVITTKGTPWSGLPVQGCGWWIDNDVASIAETLNAALMLGDAERKEMGVRGSAYVHRFGWPSIAKQMSSAYRWMLGLDDMPECIRMN